MSVSFYFVTVGNSVIMRARMEGKGVIADKIEEISPGDSFYGLSHAVLKEAGSGEVKVVSGKAKILDD